MPSQDDDAASVTTTLREGSVGGIDDKTREEGGGPPHSVPLAQLVFTFDTKALIDTVNWLCDSMQNYQTTMDRVMREVRLIQSEAKTAEETRKFMQESIDERMSNLENALVNTPQVGPSVPQTDRSLPETLPEDSEAEGKSQPQASSFAMTTGIGRGLATQLSGGVGGKELNGDQLLRKLDLDVSNFSLKVNRLDQYIKHQEQQQQARDEAQDELFKLEMASFKREFSRCASREDLETLRTLLSAKVEKLEIEVKSDLKSDWSAFKDKVNGQISEIQTGIEKIASSTEQQIKLAEEKAETLSAEEAKHFEFLTKQIQYISSAFGISLPDPSSTADGSEDPGSGPLSPMSGGPVAMPGSAGLGGRMDRLERKLEKLAVELGVEIDRGDAVEGEGGAGDGGDTATGQPTSPGSRPTTRSQPLPSRVERLETQQEELTHALQENLGLVLPGDEEASPSARTSPPVTQRSAKSTGGGGVAPPQPRAGSNEAGTDSTFFKQGTSQALRLDAIEARLNELAVACGIERPETTTEGGEGARPTTAQPLPERVNLLDAKMDEVAGALGMTPSELEAAARSDETGTLAGRVVLREEADAVSPRLAGTIAAQEDKLVSFNNDLADLEGRINVQIGDLDARVGDLETRVGHLEGSDGGAIAGKGRAGKAASNDLLDVTEKRIGKNAEEDNLAEKDPKAKRDKHLAAAKSGVASTGGLDDDGSSALIQSVVGDVQNLRKVTDDIKARLKQLTSEMQQVRSGGGGGGTGETAATAAGSSPKSGAEATQESAAAAQRAESAAEAARASAAAAEKLRQELEEILRAVEVPAAAAIDQLTGDFGGLGGLFEGEGIAGENGIGDGDSADADEKEQADEVHSYVERQYEIESRLNQLEEQLETATGLPPESEVLSGLKIVVKDVRRCLQRCELLFQLPEIKMFVKRFRRSLEVNAILHERWLGPDGATAAAESRRREKTQRGDDESEPHEPPPVGSANEDQGRLLSRNAAHARSAPDIRAPKAQREVRPQRGGKSDGKKKPFRTVVDWCRPHTPLNIDPQFRGGGGGGAGAEATANVAGNGQRSPALPPINTR